MDNKLSFYEARVIGCLIEKEITTPEHYPLSLNALTNACNQKSSREPVLELSEAAVQETVDMLVKKRLVSEKTGFGSRVAKYQHRFCNTDFSDLKLSQQELAIICVLLLRGPQTPGELRTRTDRLCKFNDVHEVEAALQRLMERNGGPLVARLPREPGKRESRYMQLFSEAAPEPAASELMNDAADLPASAQERLVQLEQWVGELREEVTRLKNRLEVLESGAEPGI